MSPTFALARFQVLSAALTPGPAERISSAYVYAWQMGVYPIFEGDGLHEAFKADFQVGEAAMSAFVQQLDRAWLSETLPTFYEIERSSGTDYGNLSSRAELIFAFRYCYLSDRFDSGFYAAILVPGEHPIEADLITKDFDRSEIYLP